LHHSLAAAYRINRDIGEAQVAITTARPLHMPGFRLVLTSYAICAAAFMVAQQGLDARANVQPILLQSSAN